jgi:two-component sensor histidine kinase
VVGLAGTGAEAVRLATSLRPDLVLMDIVMPSEPGQEMDGIDACAVIQRTLHIPVVLLTAHGEERFLLRARTALRSGYLLKPCQNAQIRAALEVALAMRAHNDPDAGFRLRESHHRIKNSFSLLHGLLRAQAHQAADPEARRCLDDAGARVLALAGAHEIMSAPDQWAAGGAAPYIEKLARGLFEANAPGDPERPVSLDVEAAAVPLDTARLVPCGIFLAEAMTNALKYAFSDRREGSIRVRFRPEGDATALLEVADDGVGLPGSPEELGRNSFGFQCLHAAAQQLGGELDISTGPGEGSRFAVRFPTV